MRRLITLPLAALLAMLGLWLGGAAAAVAHAGCTTGSITVVTHYGPPGKVSADLATADNPPGCSGIWTRAKSDDGLNYYSGIIKITGINTTASTCQDTSDCTHLVKGWVYKHPSGGTVRCKVVYPVPGAWQDCNAHPVPPARTLALALPAGGHGAMIGRRGCTAGYAYNYDASQNVWATWWRAPKPSCAANWQQRGHAIWVQRLTGNHQTTNGGWVRAAGTKSGSGNLDTTWALAKGELQWRTSSSGTVHTVCLLNC